MPQDPGNIGKGYCLKCKMPMVVEMPGRVRVLCTDCAKEVHEIIRTSKSNKNLKRTVLQPGQHRLRMPDGKIRPLRVKKGK